MGPSLCHVLPPDCNSNRQTGTSGGTMESRKRHQCKTRRKEDQ